MLAAVLVSTLWAAGRALGGSRAEAGGSLEPVRRHVVAEGETLWGIARILVGPEADPRPVIDEIREANGLGTGTLMEGQLLVLPTG